MTTRANFDEYFRPQQDQFAMAFGHELLDAAPDIAQKRAHDNPEVRLVA